ncbi:hypothetical protein AbraIFM66951_000902 [Aspergillus brasiliensis]|uniref:Xylanolytic transcriptional activator regulatory domain-containing protein n=1 Tax=Aspergillus brasiliensis TaxID=319629 RepID=A0A9W5YJ00_9EURO|nr:hypothetical protein AbraCBS73388_000913 [Aspergillus brasiliensis]GKZ42195.1 hypothetical protein AbraIFM66951_000902 [Aspergillus brasiliensis]
MRRRSRSPDSTNPDVTNRLERIEDALRVLGEDLGRIKDLLQVAIPSSSSEGMSDGEVLSSRKDDKRLDPHGDGLESRIERPTRALSTFDSSKVTTERQHPSPITISILWQWYLDAVDPVLKIFHTPSIQKDVMCVFKQEIIEDLARDCLLFAIYYASIISMPSYTCLEKLGEDKATLLERYRTGVERTLARVDLSDSRDITLLQAFTLYLTCTRLDSHGSSAKAHLPTAINMAYRLRLHLDGTEQNSSPIETKMRHHLWWQLVTLDLRTAEDHNTTPYILEPSFTTQPPSNSDDTVCHPSPSTSITTTSSTFFQILHFELTSFTRRIIFSETFNQANNYPILSPIQKHQAINAFRQSLEEKYFSHCNSTNALELITAATVQLSLVKMKLSRFSSEHWRSGIMIQGGNGFERISEGRDEAWSVVEQAYGYWKNDETVQGTAQWEVIEDLRSRALRVRVNEEDEAIMDDVGNVPELVPDDCPVLVEELAEGAPTGAAELPGNGTVCEWSIEAFEQYFQALGQGDDMSNLL